MLLSPLLLQMAVFSAIDETERTVGASSVRITGEAQFANLRVDRLEGPRRPDDALEETVEHVLGQIEAALAGMADGTYGLCRSCGRPISSERLAALPYAVRCADCAGRR